MTELDKLERQKSALLRKERTLMEKRRKAENARKYKLGGMIIKASLDGLDDDVIIGLLFAQKEALAENESLIDEWREGGIKASIAPKKVGVIVKFTDKPDQEITLMLKAKKLRWNRISKQWEGTFISDQVSEIYSIAGAENVQVIEL